jgi:hypothetical protein
VESPASETSFLPNVEHFVKAEELQHLMHRWGRRDHHKSPADRLDSVVQLQQSACSGGVRARPLGVGYVAGAACEAGIGGVVDAANSALLRRCATPCLVSRRWT